MATGNALTTEATKANTDLTPSNKADRFHDLVLLHKATLQELMHARNRAVIHILFERNALLRERTSLGGTPIEYNEWDFLTPPSPSLPYIIAPGGKDILIFNRDNVNVGTQTESPTPLENADSDVTLAHRGLNNKVFV
ncbi:hypothetical protein EI94DRAFT_1704765 [Lactarius quietus]|nr:hypothetical protein EI94DRAFT_1704765 [Lactarius quietus]